MPKLYIKGILNPFIISNSDAEQLEKAANSRATSITLDCGLIKIDAIKTVIYDHEVNFEDKNPGEYDLEDPMKRRIIIDFEKTLDSYQPARVKEIEEYGQPFRNFKHLQDKPTEKLRWQDYVKNDVLGGVKWNWVAYAMDKGFVAHNKGLWALGDIPGLNDFLFKLRAIKELQGRRAYMDQKKNEETRQMITQRSKEIDVANLF
mgnify:CR=1 FL=1